MQLNFIKALQLYSAAMSVKSLYDQAVSDGNLTESEIAQIVAAGGAYLLELTGTTVPDSIKSQQVTLDVAISDYLNRR